MPDANPTPAADPNPEPADKPAAPTPNPAPNGILLVDKPGGVTSHDVVARARRALHTRKIGHAGTLDPMATGLLILGVGPATRLLTYIVGLDKTYEATIRLGVATDSDDADGAVTAHAEPAAVARVTAADIAAGVADLTGDISQVPSTVSAIKVGGRRAYDLARAGEEVALKARDVTVSRFDVLAVRPATTDDGAPVLDLDVVVDCSSGTYIRALARDLSTLLELQEALDASAVEAIAVGLHARGTSATLEDMVTAAADAGVSVPAVGAAYDALLTQGRQ